MKASDCVAEGWSPW